MLNYVLIFEPLIIEKEIIVEEVEIIWNFKQQLRDPKLMNSIYSFQKTIGEGENYFAHPLYAIDFLQGIIEGTKLVT